MEQEKQEIDAAQSEFKTEFEEYQAWVYQTFGEVIKLVHQADLNIFNHSLLNSLDITIFMYTCTYTQLCL